MESYFQSIRARRSSKLLESLVITTHTHSPKKKNTLNSCDTLPLVSRHTLAQFGGVGGVVGEVGGGTQWDRAAKWEGLVTLSGDVRWLLSGG